MIEIRNGRPCKMQMRALLSKFSLPPVMRSNAGRSGGRTTMSYLDRDRAILEMATGKSVLHLGCVGWSDLDPASRVRFASKSLHARLSQVSRTCIGIDYAKQAIEQLRAQGTFDNIEFGDVTKLDEIPLVRDFDLVVAGDIIEHLSNPGGMLTGIAKLCTGSTIVVITTPHAFGLLNFLRFLMGRFKDGGEHVMTFNADNIRNLLERHGLEVLSINTCFQTQSKAEVNRFAFAIIHALFSAIPKLGGTLLVLARRRSS